MNRIEGPRLPLPGRQRSKGQEPLGRSTVLAATFIESTHLRAGRMARPFRKRSCNERALPWPVIRGGCPESGRPGRLLLEHAEERGMAWSGPSRLSRAQKAMRLMRRLAADPVTVGRALPGEFRQRYRWRSRAEPKFAVDEAWQEHLHNLIGATWPCTLDQQLDEIFADIGALLTARGLSSGRFTYGWYSDADRSLCRALWCVALHVRPEVVIETGVAHGVTSRVLLEALRRNEAGHLWSIDLPFPFDHRMHAETGVVVTDVCRPRWSYLEGSSRQRLPPLISEVGHVEMFVHDSLHTARNTVFKMAQAASAMPVGGVMLVDDISEHDGFAAYARRHAEFQTILCLSADRIGQFGIAVKVASA